MNELIGTLKRKSKAQLKGKRTDALVALVSQLGACVLCTICFVVPLIFATGVLDMGVTNYFYQISEGKSPKVSAIFSGFNHYMSNMLICFARGAITLVWTILLIVPGIIVGLMYSQTNFIATNNPDKKLREVLRESADLMRGRKLELFLLKLSFIGWFLLSVLTLGILLLWVLPYYKTTLANYYKHITNKENK